MSRPHLHALPLTLLLYVLLAIATPGCAQLPRPSRAMPMPTLTFPQDSAYVELPFAVVRNHVVMPVRIGDAAPVRCALDTGERGTVLFGDSVVRALGVAAVGRARIRGVGGGPDSTRVGSVYMGVTFELGGLRMSDAVLFAVPDEMVRDSPLYGSMAMGRGLLEQCIAEIDWDAQRVRLHDPTRYRPTGRGVVVPLELDATGQPYVTVRVALVSDSAFDARLVLDTGASHAVQLEPGSDPHVRVPPGAVRQRIGLGAPGVVTGWVGRAASVELGGVTFRDVPVTIPDASLGLERSEGRQGNLGAGLLSRFRVTLDLAHQRMILEPGPHVDEPIVLPPQ